MNEYQRYCWDEAVAIAGSAAEARAHKIAMAEIEAERDGPKSTGLPYIGPGSQPSRTTTKSANIPKSSDGADIYPTQQGLVIAKSVIPFIGKDSKRP